MGFPVHRPRRLRQTPAIRDLVRETTLQARNLVLPLFLEEGLAAPEPILSMPGQQRWPWKEVGKIVEKAVQAGINSFLLFGVPAEKDMTGSSSRDGDGVIPLAIRKIRESAKNAVIITDVCLCAYTSHGHCGIVNDKGLVLNDESLSYLGEMALAHARAGADIVAPSDMMDGRVGALRALLDMEGFTDTPILSYAAKYASAFYGPFRDAAHSAPAFGDRRTYQMDPGNGREALLELQNDLEEGADMLMIKPALPYLDVLREARQRFQCPLAAYQVSGEYSLIKGAAANGWIDEKQAMLETLTSIRRAGADFIMTYFAIEAANALAERA